MKPSLAIDGLLAPLASSSAARHEWRTQVRSLIVPVLVAAGLFGAWSVAAPLAGAVVAPARVKVEFNRKTVQHQEGGIVREVLVRDGQQVEAGQPLLVIADVRNEADLSLLQDRLLAARARVARSEAEARLATRFAPPPELEQDSAAAVHVQREQASFTARRRALDEQTALLQLQARESLAQAAALESQIEATAASIRLSDEELAIHTRLADQGFVQRTRLLALERAAADYRSRIGEYRGNLAAARQRAGELQARIAQLRQQYQVAATEDGKEAMAAVREVEERLRPSRDHVDRQVVRSPVAGQVMQLRVTAAGTAVGPREPLLDVVPRDERLVVEARIAPQQVEQLRLDARAQVRLMSDDARNLPLLPAKVVFVSPDLVTNPTTGASWFDATIEVDASALQQQRSFIRVQAGMPAEVYVNTAERTLLQYLTKPLNLFKDRALRET
jgi:HlyD family type I secretion membrane fusion protein